MSYMQCPKCGGFFGVIGTTVHRCACPQTPAPAPNSAGLSTCTKCHRQFGIVGTLKYICGCVKLTIPPQPADIPAWLRGWINGPEFDIAYSSHTPFGFFAAMLTDFAKHFIPGPEAEAQEPELQKTTTQYRAQFGLGPNQLESAKCLTCCKSTCVCPVGLKDAILVRALINALQDIANRAGRPTMNYSPEVEREEQRNSLDWIAGRVSRVLAEAKRS